MMPTDAELDAAMAYLDEHPETREAALARIERDFAESGEMTDLPTVVLKRNP